MARTESTLRAASAAARLAGVFGPPDPPPLSRPLDPPDPATVPLPLPGGRSRRPLREAAARLVPGAWRRPRWDPGRPAATALALVAAAAAVVAAVGVWLERPQAAPVPALPAVTVSGPSAAVAPAADATAPPSGPLVVSVAGKVRRPGLVRVPDGSRVADVLEAAGGPLPGTDLSGLNLARKAVDGEQIAVGVAAAPDAGGAGSDAGPASASGAGGRLDLNAASVGQLDALPGVGPVTAQKIVEWRAHNGRFARVDQLREVPGIGERKFAQLRDLVRV